MTYGHAERNLEATRRVVAETIALLNALPHPNPEEQLWLAEQTPRLTDHVLADPHIVAVIDEMFSHIALDGTLALDASGRRPPRRRRFDGAAAAPTR